MLRCRSPEDGAVVFSVMAWHSQLRVLEGCWVCEFDLLPPLQLWVQMGI